MKTFCVLLFPNATSEIIHLLQFKLFLTIFNCIYVSFLYYITICKADHIQYVLLSIKTEPCFLGAGARVFWFLEILAKPSSFLTFSSCGCKRGVTCGSQGSRWPLWPRSHLWAGENNNPERSLHEDLPPSAGTCSFIHTGWLFTDFPPICWIVTLAFSAGRTVNIYFTLCSAKTELDNGASQETWHN